MLAGMGLFVIFYLAGIGGFIFGRNFLLTAKIALVLVVVWHYIFAACIAGFVAFSTVRRGAVGIVAAFVGCIRIGAVQVINIGIAGSRRHLVQRYFIVWAEI